MEGAARDRTGGHELRALPRRPAIPAGDTRQALDQLELMRFSNELVAKRMQVLRALVPSASRIALRGGEWRCLCFYCFKWVARGRRPPVSSIE